jgi:hypothetical protein
MQTCVSTSSIETTLSEAAARYPPRRGWNLSWVEPPYSNMNSHKSQNDLCELKSIAFLPSDIQTIKISTAHYSQGILAT